ncbi:Ank1 [Symbiodinium sp. CCMP2592]|nr:Ank1 [Symbiodinium sp. CCMP2592]
MSDIMLRVSMMASGAEVATLFPQELEGLAAARGSCVGALKEHLEILTGHRRFKQRLLKEGSILRDDALLSVPMCLDLIILAYGTPTPHHVKAFCEAIAIDNSQTVEEFLLQPHDPDMTLLQGKAGLSLAADYGSLKSAKLLFEARADVNRADEALSQSTPLHWSSARGHLTTARWLLKSAADATKAAAGGVTPLHLACTHGHLEIAHCLAAAGADIDAAAEAGQTPMLAATSFGHLELVQWLVKAKADMTKALQDDGLTPLHLACMHGSTDIAYFLTMADGTLANAAAMDGVTPLHVASVQGHVQIVSTLIDSRADLDLVCRTPSSASSATALATAREAGHVEVARLLMEASGSKPKRRRKAPVQVISLD